MTRKHNLDFLRFLAAFAILLWHYAHFSWPAAGLHDPEFTKSMLPFYGVFKLFYTHGSFGVQLFWVLSGYVFFHTYIDRRDISFGKFYGKRFARLYPLHFVTLIIVAILQILSSVLLGKFQIYPRNDVISSSSCS